MYRSRSVFMVHEKDNISVKSPLKNDIFVDKMGNVDLGIFDSSPYFEHARAEVKTMYPRCKVKKVSILGVPSQSIELSVDVETQKCIKNGVTESNFLKTVNNEVASCFPDYEIVDAKLLFRDGTPELIDDAIVMNKYDMDAFDFSGQNKRQVNDVIFVCNEIRRLLQTLHNNAVVHGDVKPENFVLSKGIYGVMDVKVIDGDYACTKLQCEQEGIIFARGSPHYAAPEKIVGLEKRRAGTFEEERQAEMWSLGVTLLTIITSQMVMYFNEAPHANAFTPYVCQHCRYNHSMYLGNDEFKCACKIVPDDVRRVVRKHFNIANNETYNDRIELCEFIAGCMHIEPSLRPAMARPF